MKNLKKYILLLLFFTSQYGYSNPLLVGEVIDQSKNAVNHLIENAFNRLDLTVLQAAIEFRATINQSAISLQNVTNFTINQLDSQQKRIVNDLQNFERLVSNDSEKFIKEMISEKNSIISDLRLLVSNYPGAIRIIPKYALEDAEYIEFLLLGTALSKAKLTNVKINSKPTTVQLTQEDTKIVIRIPMNSNFTNKLLKRSKGKPAEVKISFDIVEYSFFEMYETSRRHFSDISYIMPKKLGTARAVFSVTMMERKTKKREPFRFKSKPVSSSRPTIRRKRGRDTSLFKVVPDIGWLIDTRTAKFDFKLLEKGCNGKRSSASWLEKSENILSVKSYSVTHLGRKSTCTTQTSISFTQWKETIKNVNLQTKKKIVMSNSDIKFDTSSLNLKKLKNIRLIHLEIKSPLFKGNGKRFLLPNERLGGLSFNYNAAAQIGYLRFKYAR